MVRQGYTVAAEAEDHLAGCVQTENTNLRNICGPYELFCFFMSVLKEHSDLELSIFLVGRRHLSSLAFLLTHALSTYTGTTLFALRQSYNLVKRIGKLKLFFNESAVNE